MLMKTRLGTFVLGLVLACVAVGADEAFIFVDSGQALGNSNTLSVALGDFDGDGDLDAIIANNGQPNTVWTNNGNGTFTNSGQALGNSNSCSVALGDLDGDGDLDAFVGEKGIIDCCPEPNKVWFNDGTGLFFDSGQTLGNNFSFSVALGDLDGDGDLDAMVANSFDQPNTIWTNDGTGTFTNSGQALGSSSSHSVALGDIDGDGDLDAIVANSQKPNTVWANNGTGIFTNSGQALGNSNSQSVTLGDIDGDGDLDAIVANSFYDPNEVWTNDGTGSFTDSGQALGGSAESRSYSVVLGDIDSDGDLDSLIANCCGQPNTVWTNDGTGMFTNSKQILGEGGRSVVLGDLDSDGDLDAMVVNVNGLANTVWFNLQGTTKCVAGDLDGDGDFDVDDVRAGMNLFGIQEAGSCVGDVNSDGEVNGIDLSYILNGWGICE